MGLSVNGPGAAGLGVLQIERASSGLASIQKKPPRLRRLGGWTMMPPVRRAVAKSAGD